MQNLNMPDEVQKSFVGSFVNYLKKLVDSHTLTADSQESVEVAVQCLQAAFDLEEETSQNNADPPAESAEGAPASTTAVTPKEIDLFELYQSFYIERNPENLEMAERIKNEGNRLMKDGKYNEALLQYNRAITFDPKNPIFYCNRAAAYIRLGDNDRAVTDCKSALLYNPNYGKAYGRLGIAYSNLCKYDEAKQAYAKAIELEPDNQDYRNNLEVARNARTPAALNVIPQFTEGLNAMLANPSIRNLFSSADIDLEQLHSMSQNPTVMNFMGQLFSGLQGGGAPGGVPGGNTGTNTGSGSFPMGGAGLMPNDMVQLFQSFASQMSQTAEQMNESTSNNTGNNGGNPPTTS